MKTIWVILGLMLTWLVLTPAPVRAEQLEQNSSGSGAHIIPKLPKTANDPVLTEGKVYPFWGPICQRYSYSVYYSDKAGRPPEYVKIYFNGQMYDMQKANAGDSDYKKGVKYIYQNVPNKYGSNFYYFEASNGLGKTRDSIIDSPDNGPVLFESDFTKNEIVLINPATGQKTWSYPTGKEWVGGLALSGDGQHLAAKTSNHIYLFDTAKPEPLWSYENKAGQIGGDVKGGIAVSADGQTIFASINESLGLFRAGSNKPVWQAKTVGNAYNVAISKDGQYMAAATAGEESNQNSNLLILFKADSNKPLWQYHSAGNFHDVTFSADGQYLAAATGCPDRRAYIFKRDSNQPVLRSEMLAVDSPVNRAKISADGKLVAFSTEDGRGLVYLFQNPDLGGSNQPLWQMPAKSGRSGRGLAFTPDGRQIVETTFAGEVIALGQSSSQPTFSWKFDQPLAAVDQSDSGQLIAVGGTAKTVYLLKPGQKEPLFSVLLAEYVSEIDVSPDGRLAAAGTGGANYFFETFIGDETTVHPCSQIIEPEPESQAQLPDCPSGQCSNNKPEQDNPGLFRPSWAIYVSLALGALAIITFGLFAKFRRRWLLTVAIILLIGTAIPLLISEVFLSSKVTKSTATPSTNPSAPASGQVEEKTETPAAETGQCGNSLCEPNLGESQTTCPRDCSGGN